MSDYITGLRGDLVDAADRHRRRRRLGGLREWPARAWRPALAASAVAAAAVAVLLAASALSPSPPVVRPAIAMEVQLGGQPQDAVLASGSLWVSDFTGRVVRVDPGSGRVTDRIDVGGHPQGIAAVAGAVWVTSPSGIGDDAESLLTRVDPGTGAVAERIRVAGYVDAVAVGAGGLWLIDKHRPRLERIDPATQARTARIPFPTAGQLAVDGDTTLWSLGDDGTVVEVDAATLETRRLRRVAGIATGPAVNSIAADAQGAWIANRSGDDVLRVEAGQVVGRIAAGTAAGPVGLADGAVWVASGDPHDLRGSHRLSHIDPDEGAVTGALDLGRHSPRAIVPAGDGVWVVAADGAALLVKNRRE